MASTTVDPATVVLEVLNQFSNYERWSLAVKNYLRAEDLWDVVEDDTEPSKETEPDKYKSWRKNDARALRIIQTCCGAYNANFVGQATSANRAWKILKEMFEPVFFDFKDPNLTLNWPPPPPSPPPIAPPLQHLADSQQHPNNLTRRRSKRHDNGSSDKIIDEGIEHLSDIGDLLPDNIMNRNETEGILLNDNVNYEEFFRHVEFQNWSSSLEFINRNPGAVRVPIPNMGGTVLHCAIMMMFQQVPIEESAKKQMHIVEKLVDLMKEEDLEVRDAMGIMAFHHAMGTGSIPMIKCIVEKNRKLVTIPMPNLTATPTPGDWLPVLAAYGMERYDVANFLYQYTPLEALKNRIGAELISQSVGRKEIDIAWDLIQKCPSLVVATDFFGHSPFNALAGKRSAFLSGRKLEFWEQWIYDSILIPPTVPMGSSHTIGIQIDDQKLENTEDSQRNINRRGMGYLFKRAATGMRYFFKRAATSLLKLLVSGHYRHLYDMKLIHGKSLAILRLMIEVTNNEKLNLMQFRFVQSSIFRAIERGHIEFIIEILKADPNCAHSMRDAKGMNMFHFAVECRQENIYSLIYGYDKTERGNIMGSTVDNLNNSVLHIVGRLPLYTQFDRIQDEALQMQRELQWFKEVETLAPQAHCDLMNITDNMTPHELFKKNHTNLMKEAEQSMKGTATSCTVVGALIVTMMFAAAFTVPGGNNGETGGPILIHEMWFMVFIVSDAFSLGLSTTSVIIFLGILTSRYAEVDFLKSLPRKMIFGLVTLFLSITTMMIAFASAIYILLEKKSGTGIPLILLGVVPVITFVSMQFRLLKNMAISTYGAGIFQKEVKPWRKNFGGMKL